MKKIKVLIADDQALMCDGLQTILENEEDIEVAGVAANGLQAYEAAGQLKPDIVLMDIRMPVMDGVESTRLIRRDYREIQVLMLTTFDDEEYIIQALTFGAAGYLLKDIQREKLVQAVHDAVKGDMLLPASIASKLAARLSNLKPAGSLESSVAAGLSFREMEISKFLVRGYSNKQIAAELSITEGTVKNHVSIIYSKIGINDRLNAAIYLSKLLGA